ncbi:hypothetical protein [Amycolatopsis sp. DSM 110486]|uniref:hypothetical protein n=1 Tax=Amycolatopsis sp. DSM 110486 TaxID=2865832 RepID=UPI001C6A35CC|nr:hypothetical protein K1T34_10775 [Amycolatopsis sp. DSM 110486]
MSQPPAPLSPAQQQDLVQRIGQACGSAVPPGWRQLRVEYRAVGRHVEADVFTTAPDGRDYPARPHPEAVRLLAVLRGGMYRRGRGTWLSATLLFTPRQPPRLDFRPDVEPIWRRPPPQLGFQDELRFFPRSEAFIPPWLRTRAGLPPLPAPWSPDTPPPPPDRAVAPQPSPAAMPPPVAPTPHADAPAAPQVNATAAPASGVANDTAPVPADERTAAAQEGTAAPQSAAPPPVVPASHTAAPAAPRQDLATSAPTDGNAAPASPQENTAVAAPASGGTPTAQPRETIGVAAAIPTEGGTEPAPDAGATPATQQQDATAPVPAAEAATVAPLEGIAAPAPEGGASPAAPAEEAAGPVAPVEPGVADPPATTAAEMRTPRVYDGLDEAGRPVVEREALPEAERERVLAYLESAPAVLASRSFDVDAFDPGRVDAVPLTFRTDGIWVWPGAVAYYLREHAVAPDPELLSHIRGRRFEVPEVGEPARELALAAVTGEQPVH